ncbi:MAG: type II secretion system protein GspE, partial [Angelakisella sp.]
MVKNIPIGEVLKEYGYITQTQIDEAVALQKQQPGTRLGELLIQLGYVTDRQRLEALGKKLNYQLVEMSDIKVEMEAVSLIPRQLAEKYKLIAVKTAGGAVSVVLSDPLDFYAIEDIRQVLNCPMTILLAPKEQISDAIEYCYAEIEARRVAAETSSGMTLSFDESLAKIDDSDRDAPAVKLLNSMLVRGFITNASDIHIEADTEYTNIRMRIDGMLMDYVRVARALHQ